MSEPRRASESEDPWLNPSTDALETPMMENAAARKTTAAARRPGNWLPGVLLSLVAIGLLSRVVAWRDVVSALRAIPVGALVVAIGFYLGAALCRALCWQMILQRQASVRRVFIVIQEGYLLNNLLPFRLGELGRALLMGRTINSSPLHVLSTIVIERLYDLALAATLVLVTLPVVLNVERARWLAVTVLLLIGVAFVVLYFVVRNQHQLAELLQRWLSRWPRLAHLLVPRLEPVLAGLGVLSRPSQLAVSLGWMALSWLFLTAEYYILLRTIAPQAPIWAAAFTLGAGMMGGALPSAPSGLGVYEASVVGALTLFAVPVAPALSYAVAIHLIHILFSCAVGLWGMTREGETLFGLYHQVRQTFVRT